jgi:hypothetical protein
MTLNNRKSTSRNMDEVVVRGINTVVESYSANVWIGRMSDLTTALNKVLTKNERTLLPRSPSALRVVINRVVNRIRTRGIGVRFGRTTDSTRTRFVRFSK